MSFKKGDYVRVCLESSSYNGKYSGYAGTVCYMHRYNPKPEDTIGVALDMCHNPNSSKGCFYFKMSELNAISDPQLSAKQSLNQKYGYPFTIKNVIFNPPAVIVLWDDGSKTVVKCSENDIFDPEKGLAMAISKKALGNQGNYYNTFKKYLPEEEDIDDFGLRPTMTLGEQRKKTFHDFVEELEVHIRGRL